MENGLFFGEISLSRAVLATCGSYIIQEKVKMTRKFPTLSCKLICFFLFDSTFILSRERKCVCARGGSQGVRDTLGVVCF